MSPDERKQVARVIAGTAKYYSKIIDQDFLSMMLDDLEELPADQVISAYKTFRDDSRNNFFPLPSKIREIINPKDDPNALAIEVSSRCLEAVRKYGWTNEDHAMEHIGELGRYAVKRYGGWKFICENLGSHIEPSTFIAQLREIIRSRANSNNQGFSETPHELTSNTDIQKLLTVKPVELK